MNSALLSLSALCLATSRTTAWVVGIPTTLQWRPVDRLPSSSSSSSSSRCIHGPHSKAMTTTTGATSAESAAAAAAGATGAAKNPRPSSTAVVGGGPTGLAVALMLARRGYRDITVLERLDEPPPPASSEWGNPERSYNLGIGGRGQVALAKLGAADRVFSWCAEAVGRKDWSPQAPAGEERFFTERKYKTKVIARDRLTSCLLEEIREKHSDAVTVRFGVECTGVEWLELDGGGKAGGTLALRDSSSSPDGCDTVASELTAEFIVAADGVKSAIRGALEADGAFVTRTLSGGDLRVKRFPRKNEFAYKIVPFNLDAGWRNDLNYSHRTKEEINLESLPTKEGMQVGVLLFRPDDQRVVGLKGAADARALFEDLFPQFAGMITEEAYERLASQEVARLPSFSYAGPTLHVGKSAVLLGDAIKSVKPYFGLGANTALEDCIALDRCLEDTGDDLEAALPLYSRLRAPEAKDLVELSRGFDRTGLAGFFGFILPIILDAIFHRAAPGLFAPNTIAYLQQEGVTFRHVRVRKALDRIMQGTVLGGVGAAAFAALRAAAGAVAPFVVSALASVG